LRGIYLWLSARELSLLHWEQFARSQSRGRLIFCGCVSPSTRGMCWHTEWYESLLARGGGVVLSPHREGGVVLTRYGVFPTRGEKERKDLPSLPLCEEKNSSPGGGFYFPLPKLSRGVILEISPEVFPQLWGREVPHRVKIPPSKVPPQGGSWGTPVSPKYGGG